MKASIPEIRKVLKDNPQRLFNKRCASLEQLRGFFFWRLAQMSIILEIPISSASEELLITIRERHIDVTRYLIQHCIDAFPEVIATVEEMTK